MGAQGPSILVLLISSAVSIVATVFVNRIATDREQTRFNHSTEQLRQAVENGLAKYLTLLDNVRAFSIAKIAMDQPQFQAYVEALQLPEKYQGITGLGLALKFPSSDTSKLLEVARTAGMEGFKIWPPSDYPWTCPLMLIEPSHPRNLEYLGYDLFADVEHRKTALRAAEQGVPMATATRNRNGAGGASRNSGFLLLVPGYTGGGMPETVEARRTNVAGFVQCVVDTKTLLGPVLGDATNSSIALRIHDGEDVSENNERRNLSTLGKMVPRREPICPRMVMQRFTRPKTGTSRHGNRDGNRNCGNRKWSSEQYIEEPITR